MEPGDILIAYEECERFLLPTVDADWQVRIPDLEWTVAQAIAHAAEAPLWYAYVLCADGDDWGPMDLSIVPGTSPVDLVGALKAAAGVLHAVLGASSPGGRAYHPWGRTDPSGCAAMACDEYLIHTDDAARALDLNFQPDPALCARVRSRLFPDAPTDVPPWESLRWANGRTALRERPRLTEWRWYSTPVAER